MSYLRLSLILRRSSYGWRRVRAVGTAVTIAVAITVSLSLLYNSSSTDEISTFESFSLPQNVVLDAEQATDHANQAATRYGNENHQSTSSSLWGMQSLGRLQSLSWRTLDPLHRVLQPDKAADYGLAAAKAAQDQFEHTLVVILHILPFLLYM